MGQDHAGHLAGKVHAPVLPTPGMLSSGKQGDKSMASQREVCSPKTACPSAAQSSIPEREVEKVTCAEGFLNR